MSHFSETTLIDSADLETHFDSAKTCRAERVIACFHCGETCRDSNFIKDKKHFCCNGCLTVHDILTSSGLEKFYELNARPGTRIKRETKREQWLFLDDPKLQRQLLDFSDDKQSRVTFLIPQIHCIACVWLLENLFRLNPGISRSSVNFQKREVVIQFAAQKIKLSEIVALLSSIGYEPSLSFGELEKTTVNPVHRKQWLQIGLAGFAFGNIMLFSLPTYFGMDSFSAPVFKTLFGWLSLALALPVLIFSASDYWKSACLSARQRTLTLDIPIALGLAALYAQSAFAVISGRGEHFLDSMAGLIFFLLCGRIFQHKTHERLAFDRDYKSFFPLAVTRVGSGRAGSPLPADGAHGVTRPTGEREEQVSLSQLSVGDRILIRNGELIPADSKLISESALIDYSFVTGESEPVAKVAGDYLYAGGKQIGAAIKLETVKPVSQSYLTSLWNHEAFQKDRNDNLNTLTNRYSRLFTFIVIAIALSAFAFWSATGNWPRGLKAFTSVLIVACPCALALAAPFTLGTAQRLLARFKVFLKNALVLERMARIDTIVFDKTGTLTANENRISFEGSPLTSADARLIYCLARQSTHPHSISIAESLAERSALPVEGFNEKPGCGIQGIVCGKTILIGSRAWLESRGASHKIALPGNATHVAIDGQYLGAFSISNSLRPHADKLLRQLVARYEIALLSGDNERERERFRHLFGTCANLNFNQSPLDKLGFIKRLQQSGKNVMMVGDGLNDAGALKQSDVGVAVVEKVGTFSPASDVILEAANVPSLFEILVLARLSVRIVRASFFVSAIYNLIGVSIAAVGWMSPVICAILMPVSSISVVLFACGMTAWTARKIFGVRWQSVATTPLSGLTRSAESGVALRFPPQSKMKAAI